MDIIAQLKAERDKAAQQVNALDTAIKALSGLNSAGGSARGRRTMSAAARARIAAAQRARWARTRGQKVVSVAPKRTSQRQVWRGSEPQIGRDGQSGDGKRKRPSSDELSAAFSFS